MSDFTPQLGFYVQKYSHSRRLKNRPVILEIVSFTKTGMMNLKDWFFINNEEWRAVYSARKKPKDNFISYPLHTGDRYFVYCDFSFKTAKYYKSLAEYEEDNFQVEGETILI